MINFKEHSHTRFNPLTGEWVLVSPHRSKRPWQGQTEAGESKLGLEHNPDCYLCPGNKRANGEQNPIYDSTYAFTNDFAALQYDIPEGILDSGLLQAKNERGICRVICFSPKHNLTIPEMKPEQIEKVVDLWINECLELGKKSAINHIQIFENKGSVMGCSNAHPHGQIWGQNSIPVEPLKKHNRQEDYFNNNKSILLLDYLQQELELDERIVYQNEHFVVLVPFWAIWPYETMIVPKRKMSHITKMNQKERSSLADAYRVLTIKYDNLFQTSFPYSAGIHQAPFDGQKYPFWQWHMTFYPPLLRSSTVKKFMVGYEMFANAQRDITAEQASDSLKAMEDTHYSKLK